MGYLCSWVQGYDFSVAQVARVILAGSLNRRLRLVLACRFREEQLRQHTLIFLRE